MKKQQRVCPKNICEIEEGVDNAQLHCFGDAVSAASDSQFFILFGAVNITDDDYALNFRFTGDGFIELIKMDNEPECVIARFRLVGKPLKDELLSALRKYLEGSWYYTGYERYGSSPFISREEYEDLIAKILDKEKDNEPHIEKCRTRLIRKISAKGLKPEPYGIDGLSWRSKCLGNGPHHTMVISTVKDEWYCPVCNRGGDFDSLLSWANELDHEKLSSFVKALYSGKELTREQNEWWWCRY